MRLSRSKQIGVALRSLRISLFMCLVVVIRTRAQDAKPSTAVHGLSEYETTVHNAEVVYASGDDLIAKLDNDRIEYFVVPDSQQFMVNGKEVSTRALEPGTNLSQPIITTTAPHMVARIQVLQGIIWEVTPPTSLILRFDDGSTTRYAIPSAEKFYVNGKERTAFELRKGMRIWATIVTDQSQTVMEQTKSAVEHAPKPETPAQIGTLLIFVPIRVSGQPEENTTRASAENPPPTGTTHPLSGLGVAPSIAMSLVKYCRFLDVDKCPYIL